MQMVNYMNRLKKSAEELREEYKRDYDRSSHINDLKRIEYYCGMISAIEIILANNGDEDE